MQNESDTKTDMLELGAKSYNCENKCKDKENGEREENRQEYQIGYAMLDKSE